MKNKIFYKVCACAAFFALCACSSPDAGDTACKMGVVLPLGGKDSAAANAVLDGMMLACDEVNSKGGILGVPLSLDVRDSSDSDFSFFESFDSMRSDGIRVFHLGLSEETVFLNQTTSKCGDVFVNWLSDYPPITLEGSNSVRIFINGAQEGDLMSMLVKRGDKDVNIVVMNVDNKAGKSVGDYLAFNLKLEKTNLYKDVFGSGEKNFSVFREQIARLSADYVFYAGTGRELGDFVSSLSDGGFSGDVISTCPYFSKKIPHSKNMRLFEVATLFEQGKINTKESKAFVEAFKRRYGRSPNWLSAYGYDSVKLAAMAMEKSRFNPAKMRPLFAGKSFNGAIGEIVFDKSGDSTSPLTMVEK